MQWSRALSEAERASREASTAEEVTAFLVDLFLGGDIEPDVRAALGKDLVQYGNNTQALRRFAHGVVTLPEFQLA